MITIAQAKKHLSDNYESGTKCPCCDQFVKLYKRRITGAMAYALILLSKESGWVHVENFLKSKDGLPPAIRGDVPKLRHWGLLKKWEGKREDGCSRNGYYKMTVEGVQFVSGYLRVQKFAYMFNGNVRYFGPEQCGIVECLGKKFNYKKLMESVE